MTETTTAPTGARAAAAARKAELEAKGLRHCVGSQRYGIEPHEAPINEFPLQPSQPDGIGRMCHEHWNQYTSGLARDRKAASGATTDGPTPGDKKERVAKPKPTTKKAAAEAARAQVRRESAKGKKGKTAPEPKPFVGTGDPEAEAAAETDGEQTALTEDNLDAGFEAEFEGNEA